MIFPKNISKLLCTLTHNYTSTFIIELISDTEYYACSVFWFPSDPPDILLFYGVPALKRISLLILLTITHCINFLFYFKQHIYIFISLNGTQKRSRSTSTFRWKFYVLCTYSYYFVSDMIQSRKFSRLRANLARRTAEGLPIWEQPSWNRLV